MFLVFVYIWLPFMILPVQAALERVPGNLHRGLGRSRRRPRPDLPHVILPLALPGIVAGSIFTFSLTLGDYIIPQIVGTSRLFIGQVVYAQQGTAGNIPLAAAFTVVPIVDHGRLSLGRQAHGGLRCALTPTARAARPEARRRRRAAVPASAAGADLPLRLHHRGAQLPVPAARPDAAMVRRRLGPRRTSGRRCGCRSRSPRSSTAARAGPRHARRGRAVARQVLRPRGDLAAVHPADRAARHHHRHRAALGLRHHGHPVLVLDHRARPRHLLHRRRLQQRRRALPPHSPAS